MDFRVLIPFGILVFLKFLLDLRLCEILVKYLYWIPVRNYFRTKPFVISGQWEQAWGAAGSSNFKLSIERHGHPLIRQLGSYCYGEFVSKGVTYVVFGRVINEYFVGEWYDKNDSVGYFGAFHLQIVGQNVMKGQWVGHSKTIQEVRSDRWVWKKVC